MSLSPLRFSTAHAVPPPQYSDSKLYDQLLYFDMLFDVEKARAKVAGGLDQREYSFLSLFLETSLNTRSIFYSGLYCSC